MTTFFLWFVVVSHVVALSQDQCVYKGQGYQQDQKWQDGCDYECECLNSTTGQYRCKERCAKHSNILAHCRFEFNPHDPCCLRPVCPDPFLPDTVNCGPGFDWNNYFNCYLISDGAGNQTKTWRESRNYCRSKGGDLVSIDSADEQRMIQNWVISLNGQIGLELSNIETVRVEVIQDHISIAHHLQQDADLAREVISHTSATDLWIGLSEVDFDSTYKWSDGLSVSYLNWLPGEPNDFSGAEDCVEMKVSNGKWNDAHCSKRKGFVCKKTPWAVPKNPAPPLIRGNCPPGYTADRYNNKCYRIFTTPMTWYYASKFCMTQGAEKYYLASINSDLDNAFLTTLLRGLNISPWIGLKKRTTGELFWSDNYDITYTNWYHGEPNGRNDMEMCAQIYGTQNNAGRWGALSCENKLPFICETKRKIYITTPNPISNPCESKKGYRPFGNACFKAMETPATWSAAQDYCKAHGAFLVTISNEFEQDFLRLLVNYEEFWTGLNDIERAGTYTWMNEAWPVIYTAWDDGEPSARDGACVSMNSATGRWFTTNCSRSLAYVCKITADDPPVTSPTPNGQCSGRDWLLNGRKCLLFRHIDYKTYLDATLECQREQASLVSIHSTAENQFLVQTIQTKYWAQKEGFWTGLHGSSSTGFSWSDQSPMNFFNWDQKPVSHYEWGNEDKCVEIDSQNGKWKYQDCAQKRGYICQKNPVVDMNTQTLPLHSNSNLASTSNTPTRQTPSLQTFTHKPDASIPTTNRNTQTLPTASTISPYTGPSVPVVDMNTQTLPPHSNSNLASTSNTPTRQTPSLQTFTHKPDASIPTTNRNTQTLPTASTISPYTGPSVPGALKSSGGSTELNGGGRGGSKVLNGGSIAGILVAAIIVVVLVIALLVVFKRVRQSRGGATLSFDNTAYRYDTKQENGESDT